MTLRSPRPDRCSTRVCSTAQGSRPGAGFPSRWLSYAAGDARRTVTPQKLCPVARVGTGARKQRQRRLHGCRSRDGRIAAINVPSFIPFLTMMWGCFLPIRAQGPFGVKRDRETPPPRRLDSADASAAPVSARRPRSCTGTKSSTVVRSHGCCARRRVALSVPRPVGVELTNRQRVGVQERAGIFIANVDSVRVPDR